MKLFLTILLALFAVCKANADESLTQLVCTKNTKNIWYYSKAKVKIGVVMLSHGLNVDPTKMTDLIQFYNSKGYDVLLTVLTGHDGNAEEFKNVTRQQWLQDMYSAYCDARASADTKKLPLIFSGYSVSGLIGEDLMENYPELNVHFNKVILFAPAISVRPLTKLVMALNIFGKDFFVPSLSNPDYRVCDGTPIQAYDSLFDSIHMLRKVNYSHSSQTPTLVLIDPDDELVSTNGIKSIIASNHLGNWSLVEVSNKEATAKVRYHHFIIAEESVGARVWQNILNTISTTLDAKPPSATSSSEYLPTKDMNFSP